MNRSFILGTAILAGTIIGAGIFSLPYVFAHLGVVVGAIYLFLFGVVYFFIHKMYAELVDQFPEDREFYYLLKKFISPAFARFAIFTVISGIVLELTVYLILSPSFGTIVF